MLLSYIFADKVLNAGVSFKLYLVCLLLTSNNGITAIMIDFKTKLLKYEQASSYFLFLALQNSKQRIYSVCNKQELCTSIPRGLWQKMLCALVKAIISAARILLQDTVLT